ncbi:MAG: hypothetical protein EPO20_13980 [Betaproteobacteria bacterium]|nr:MAG: hypothetical protein EPO20_13980 [Betaproteobacteria bacterium]
MENGVLAAGAIAVEPEILERQDFDPPWVLGDSSPEWRQRVSDQTRSQRCRVFFRQDSRALRDNRLVVAKVTPEGEVFYRLSFNKPDAWGFIARPTFTRKHGYLYFDWWDASTGMNREVKKILRMRVKEPAGPGR